jgi:hypothetical protein
VGIRKISITKIQGVVRAAISARARRPRQKKVGLRKFPKPNGHYAGTNKIPIVLPAPIHVKVHASLFAATSLVSSEARLVKPNLPRTAMPDAGPGIPTDTEATSGACLGLADGAQRKFCPEHGASRECCRSGPADTGRTRARPFFRGALRLQNQIPHAPAVGFSRHLFLSAQRRETSFPSRRQSDPQP